MVELAQQQTLLTSLGFGLVEIDPLSGVIVGDAVSCLSYRPTVVTRKLTSNVVYHSVSVESHLVY